MKRSHLLVPTRLLSYLGAMLLALSTVLTPTAAWAAEWETSEIILPVRIYDFNADNIFFEYNMEGGAHDDLNLDWRGTDASPANGLVESTLVNDQPVYTQEAVEYAADRMAAELMDTTSSWPTLDMTNGANSTSPTKLYEALRNGLAIAAQGTTYKNQLNPAGADPMPSGAKTTSPFWELGWTPSGTENTDWKKRVDAEDNANTKGLVTTDYDTLWQLGKDIVGHATDCSLSRTDTLVANTTYYLWGYKGAGEMSFEVKDSSGSSLTTATCTDGNWYGVSFTTGSDTGITVSITPSVLTTDTKLANYGNVHLLTGTNADKQPETAGLDRTVVWKTDGTAADQWGTLYTVNKGAFVNDSVQNGSKLLYQDGDGIVSYGANTVAVSRTFEVVGNQYYVVKFWNTKGWTVTVEDASGSSSDPLLTYTSENGGWSVDGDCRFMMPTGVSSIKVTLTPPALDASDTSKISAIDITPTGNVNMGTYEASKAKYADASKDLSDVETIMDYCYYMMNHFTQSATAANGLFGVAAGAEYPFGNVYVPQITGIALTNEYTGSEDAHRFQITYEQYLQDYNDPNSNRNAIVLQDGILRKDHTVSTARTGFFPLDGHLLADGSNRGFGQMYTVDVDENVDYDIPAHTETHNYHYAMASASEFTYKAGSGQYFFFEGDDDTYLFINNQLVLDIGGAHLHRSGRIDLDSGKATYGGGATLSAASEGNVIYLDAMADSLGLVDGEVYPFDFFYMERHTIFSDFTVETNIKLVPRNSAALDSPTIVKKVAVAAGSADPDGETFAFTMAPGENNPAEVQGLDTTATITTTGTEDVTLEAAFGTGYFLTAGTYTYTITEDAGSAANWIYSDEAYTWTVVVEDDANGVANIVSSTLTKGGSKVGDVKATFTNTYDDPMPTPVTPSDNKGTTPTRTTTNPRAIPATGDASLPSWLLMLGICTGGVLLAGGIVLLRRREQ